MDATWLCGGNLRRGCRGGCVQPPARHAGQARDAYGWEIKVLKYLFQYLWKYFLLNYMQCDMYFMYIYNVYIYIGWSTVSVEVCWSTWLWTLKCNWEDSWGWEKQAGSGVMDTPLGGSLLGGGHNMQIPSYCLSSLRTLKLYEQPMEFTELW